MNMKGAKALAAKVKDANRQGVSRSGVSFVVANYRITERKNDISFDPYDQMMESVVDLAKEGALDFLDPESVDTTMAGQFEPVFKKQLMVEYGTENGAFLFKRYKEGKVSPKIRRQIESIREYAVGVFRRQYLSQDNAVLKVVSELYKTAYHEGGLNRIDNIITSLNSKLKQAGCRFGIGPGTACMEDNNGCAEWIAVIFSDLERQEFLSLEWCQL